MFHGNNAIKIAEDQIVDQLMNESTISTAWIQRKYNLTYESAVKIRDKWQDRQPKQATMQERMEMFKNNPIIRKSPPKKRKTPFFINGKMLHSWVEAQTELNKLHGGI